MASLGRQPVEERLNRLVISIEPHGLHSESSYNPVAACSACCLIIIITSDGPSGNRNNCWLAGQPRVIELAPDTYTISSTLYEYTDTVTIGDVSNPAVTKAFSGFNGDYLVVGGQGDGSDHPSGGFGGDSLLMFKNVILDTTSNAGKTGFTALSWAVAQNCALVNVKISMPQSTHTGMVMAPGSIIFVSDVHFTYGNVGLHWAGHQQGQLKGMSFDKCTTGILIDGGNTISILAPSCNTVVQYPNFMLNISNNNGQINLVTVDGNAKIGDKDSLGTFIYGNTRGVNSIKQTNPSEKAPNRPAALSPGGKYPSISAPQYADKKVSDVINLKDVNQNGGFNLHGDGNVDDTQALPGALNTAASNGKIADLPFGVYKVTSTAGIPPGTELYGEAGSTISGFGKAFASASNPTPVVQIGSTPDQKGTARVQDIRFTVHEALAGAILLRIYMAGNSPGYSLEISLIQHDEQEFIFVKYRD
ncbi:hypothetical protein NHJ6243_001328 [Beauveria neobassiana]